MVTPCDQPPTKVGGISEVLRITRDVPPTRRKNERPYPAAEVGGIGHTASVNRIFFAVLLFGLILLSGCLKEKTEQECLDLKAKAAAGAASRYAETFTGEIAGCYHELAVWHALHKDNDSAIEACDTIGDSSVFSQSERNNCYTDIAQVLHDNTTCEKIETSLLEEPTTFAGLIKSYKEQCIAKATPPQKADVCGAMVFILAPLFALFLSLWKK